MKNLMKLALTGALALVLATEPALAAGFLTNGLPPAGGTQFPGTIPLTGAETIPVDTNLSGGQAPQSESVTVQQLATAINTLALPNIVFNTATNTTGFTATTAQLSGADQLQVLSLTGTLGAGAALTTPTATALIAALGGYGIVGNTYVLRFINNSSANFAWTITAGAGVTVTGTATVAQNVWREYLVTVTATGTPAVTLQNIGAGTN